jgi:hypothetical protein
MDIDPRGILYRQDRAAVVCHAPERRFPVRLDNLSPVKGVIARHPEEDSHPG